MSRQTPFVRRACAPLGLAGAAVLAGCQLLMDVPAPSSTGPCAQDTDCPSSDLCAQQMCHADCTVGRACSDGEVCTQRADGKYACLPPAEASVEDAGSDGNPDSAIAIPSTATDRFDGSVDGRLMSAAPPVAPTDASPQDGPPYVDAYDSPSESAQDVYDGPSEAADSGTDADAGTDAGCPTPSSVVLFGGVGGNGTLDDTWTWNGSVWSHDPLQVSPTGRSASGMASLCGKAVLFGGVLSARGSFVADPWTWDGSHWMSGATAPIPAQREDPAFAALDETLVLFGGYVPTSSIVASDTWIWNGTTWANPPLTRSPPARGGAVAAPFKGGILLFGGDDGSGSNPFADTWQWDGSTWTQLFPPRSPPGRYLATLGVLDDELVLFGGFDGSMDTNDTWVWDGTTWSKAMPLHVPPARDSAGTATLGNRSILFGGSNEDGFLPDMWSWDGADWTPQPFSSPTARSSFAMTSF
jgi:Kelch motif